MVCSSSTTCSIGDWSETKTRGRSRPEPEFALDAYGRGRVLLRHSATQFLPKRRCAQRFRRDGHSVIPEQKVVALFGAGTLAEFRGRGLQTALLRLRMQVAAQDGCEVAVIVTQGGSTSQRNAERLGFRVAYSKATMIRKF